MIADVHMSSFSTNAKVTGHSIPWQRITKTKSPSQYRKGINQFSMLFQPKLYDSDRYVGSAPEASETV